MSGRERPRLLLVPSFTELEWGIRPELEKWAQVATFDMPGVGRESLPADLDTDPDLNLRLLADWREASVSRALREVERLRWEDFVVVTDAYGHLTAVLVAERRRDAVQGLALGHASLSHATEGERAPMSRVTWDVMAQLARQGGDAFVRYGIAQATRGGISEDVAKQMVERFPDMKLVTATIEALAREPEPIGDQLRALDLPLLLGKHEGCLGHTEEGFEDIVAAFPRARTVICPETCCSSPAFAEALRRFCDEIGAVQPGASANRPDYDQRS
jgi:pimeloyl-ACP methyl ester carboxylesterase